MPYETLFILCMVPIECRIKLLWNVHWLRKYIKAFRRLYLVICGMPSILVEPNTNYSMLSHSNANSSKLIDVLICNEYCGQEALWILIWPFEPAKYSIFRMWPKIGSIHELTKCKWTSYLYWDGFDLKHIGGYLLRPKSAKPHHTTTIFV